MSADNHFLRIKKLTGKNIIKAAAKHNLRQIAAEIGADSHIDAARIPVNVILVGPGSADEVARNAQAMMDGANVKPLKVTAIRALEVVFSLPPDTTADQRRFFEDATEWAGAHFGVPTLSAVIHNDEAAPHCHVLLLPLVEGRMVGSDLHGGKPKLLAMQADFYDKVGRKHGLARTMPKKRHSTAICLAAINMARECLRTNSALQDDVIDALLVPHAKQPEQLMAALGLAMPVPVVAKGGFATMMTKPCKLEVSQPRRPRNPIWLADPPQEEKAVTICSVWIADSEQSFSPPDTPQPTTSTSPPAPADSEPEASQEPASIELVHTAEDDQQHAEGVANIGYTRESLDQPSELWNGDTGEWVQQEPPKASHRANADRTVQAMLSRFSKAPTGPHKPPQRHHQANQSRMVRRC